MCGIFGIFQTNQRQDDDIVKQIESLSHNINLVQKEKLIESLALPANMTVLAQSQNLSDLVGIYSERYVELEGSFSEKERDVEYQLLNDRLVFAQQMKDFAEQIDIDVNQNIFSIIATFNAIDILEIRGRDSAGILLRFVDVSNEATFKTLVYKVANECGSLGDNIADIKQQMIDDHKLANMLTTPGLKLDVIAHTRWASIGEISIANTHPVGLEKDGQYVYGVLNGDIDNYAQLMQTNDVAPPEDVTTDAYTIPALLFKQYKDSTDQLNVFRRFLTSTEGSTAILELNSYNVNLAHAGLRGSGQGLLVGREAGFTILASEPYGLIQLTNKIIRLVSEGDTSGELVEIDIPNGDIIIESIGGVVRSIDDDSYENVGVTTRDINLDGFSHFFLKEVNQAATSFQKTIENRLVVGSKNTAGTNDKSDKSQDGYIKAELNEEELPNSILTSLQNGEINKVIVIGQGTAAIAAQATAKFLESFLSLSNCSIMLNSSFTTATELSGYGLRDDMSDTLIVAISQSGTTTDTNRTVDIVRDRGAKVLCIVNRRQSDLTKKSDGVIYTSDGRDAEMSVASTKALYSQIAAGIIFAGCLVQNLSPSSLDRVNIILQDLLVMPEKIGNVVNSYFNDDAVKNKYIEAAQAALSKNNWSVTGSGWNYIAAEELRIKTSELCYKTISLDITENKKHIDLSAEPFVVTCAAGLFGSAADDVAKECAIFSSHEAYPVAIINVGENRFSAAKVCIEVPKVDYHLSFILSMVAGHLLSYSIAKQIDLAATELRMLRQVLSSLAHNYDMAWVEEKGVCPLLNTLSSEYVLELTSIAKLFSEKLLNNSLVSTLETSQSIKLYNIFQVLLGRSRLTGKELPHSFIIDTLNVLSESIEALARPIDAIKHQAKTVTVGISRSDDVLVREPLVAAILEDGVLRDLLTYPVLRNLKAIGLSVKNVLGITRYKLTNGDVQVVSKSGISENMKSRADVRVKNIGSKVLVAKEQTVHVVRGSQDGLSVVLVPEVDNGVTTGITLLHCEFLDRLSGVESREMLEGYKNKYLALSASLSENGYELDDAMLENIAPKDQLIQPVAWLTDQII